MSKIINKPQAEMPTIEIINEAIKNAECIELCSKESAPYIATQWMKDAKSCLAVPNNASIRIKYSDGYKYYTGIYCGHEPMPDSLESRLLQILKIYGDIEENNQYKAFAGAWHVSFQRLGDNLHMFPAGKPENL